MSEQIISIKERTFLPKDFKIKNWDGLKPYYDQLKKRAINNEEQLNQWFLDRSELESVIAEEAGWRYIRMTCDTTNEAYTQAYEDFVRNIQPHIAPYSDELNKKALASPALAHFKTKTGFDIMIREMEKDVTLFREENIPLFTEIQSLSQKYGSISGAMSVEHEGKELTLQQAGVLLQSTDRSLRENIYHKVAGRRLQDQNELDKLFNELIKKRHQVAKNAGFDNFRDYMFKAMGRFDYSPEDCFEMHRSVEQAVVPLLNQMAQMRKDALAVDSLRPYDKAVDISGKEALVPFRDPNELVAKTIRCFDKLDPFLGDCIRIMEKMGHLDLESRKGKAPGGYNYPLAEVGVPFIFMNATSTHRDMVTMLHEGGHAVHSFLTRDLEISDFKNAPSEVAELASMSMELISMDHWDEFFDNEEELKRAKREQLEQIIETLPWVATIDKFQHWIYENPQHAVEERRTAWLEILGAFSDSITDWSGLEKNKANLWQKQLHLYEVPFYYIEYGMAQLGAIAVWKNFKENRVNGIRAYINALKLGYTKSIPEVYAAADIKFDFSKDYIEELMSFVKEEYEKIQ